LPTGWNQPVVYMQNERVKLINTGEQKQGPVIYWMSRDQRVEDNWSLLYAQQIALEKQSPLIVVFCLVNRFLNAGLRQFDFMLNGLKESEKLLKEKNIPFILLRGLPYEKITKFINKSDSSVLVTDFDPLKIKREWKEKISLQLSVPFYEVDSHNIVPVWSASSKQEYGAYTLRPKIKKLLPQFLEDFPELKIHPYTTDIESESYDWERIIKLLPVDKNISPVNWLLPGSNAAKKMLMDFIDAKLSRYNSDRNDPTKDTQSGLSPYLHFGHISSQRIALEINKLPVTADTKESFLEELIIRKELSDNFCLYCPDYDNFNGFTDWAKKSLDEHRSDKREYIYSKEIFETAGTHDVLWNAAQMEMVNLGKMSGYMRMYWAKKILEWSSSPEDAMDIAIYLNDKYELDGRDPNGYAGIAWSIGGVHDRAWFDREVFGKIRYMNYNGCKNKFDVDGYISKNTFAKK